MIGAVTLFRKRLKLKIYARLSFRRKGSSHTALLNRIRSKAFRLINSSPLTDYFDCLSHRRNVALLFFFYRYFHADCCSELANCMHPSFSCPRCRRLSTSSHSYYVHLWNARVNQYLHSCTLTLVNSSTLFFFLFFHLPMNLNSFKRGLSRHLWC